MNWRAPSAAVFPECFALCVPDATLPAQQGRARKPQPRRGPGEYAREALGLAGLEG